MALEILGYTMFDYDCNHAKQIPKFGHFFSVGLIRLYFGHLYWQQRPFCIKLKFDQENQLFVFKFTKTYPTWITKYFLLIRDNHETFFGDEYLNLQLGKAGKSDMVISVGLSVQPTQNWRSKFLKCPLMANKSPFHHQNHFLM